MVKYNTAFFKLYENFFLKLKEKLGTKGIEIWKETMQEALTNAYLEGGAQKYKGVDEFIKFVGERDKGVRNRFPRGNKELRPLVPQGRPG